MNSWNKKKVTLFVKVNFLKKIQFDSKMLSIFKETL